MGGDEERFKQVSEAYQFLVKYYEDHPRRERGGTRSTKTKNPNKKTSNKKTSNKKTSNKKTSNKKDTPRDQQKKSRSQSQADSHYQQSTTQDHRQAWRAWREQVDRDAQKRANERENYSRASDDHARSSTQNHSTDQQTSSSYTRSSGSSTSWSNDTGEIVEASVVPTWGDSVRRWGHVAGTRLRSIKDQTGGRLKRWYRHSARSIFEPGRDEKLKLEVDLQTLIHGKQQRIAINRDEPCPQCQIAHGQLRIDDDQSAATWAEGCDVCGGEGRVGRRQEISIYIPAGADQGNKLKVKNKGGAGLNGADDGDLQLLLTPVALPRGFSRRGANLELQQAVSAQLLQSGGVLPIQTLRGQVRIKVPPGFRSGGKLVIPDEGLPTWNQPELLGTLTVCLRAIT